LLCSSFVFGYCWFFCGGNIYLIKIDPTNVICTCLKTYDWCFMIASTERQC